MILIGQYDSPFVRRVGITLALYGLPFEHRPWSVFSDGEKVRAFNPLMRVPTLVLGDGEVLFDSADMIDALDDLVGPERALCPRSGPLRRQTLSVVALAMGAAEKAVSLFYELRLHEQVSAVWSERCSSQILSALAALERDRAARTTPYWFGETPGHADIAAAVALRFIAEAHPGLVDVAAMPALAAHAAGLEALPVFVEISQPFVAPA
ncbi:MULTISPECIES: glutathione S-transferase family protein [Bosea]|uniref:glutathione S-transferase family protein n=1 Tax=Bosea TaxID=85413 RepID=UPI0021503BA5|nr:MULTISPECIES: glutathione S-transferase family protein [Bosea]MCR4520376.1 glutathione S-transferase family protein [Bosea sp. 47.2.35]MDR6827727.1 glutathione S-transferase [Bosea robiniae]MDR6894579.1 glutathione S-transferase [Bosea sp. BE109]MDR7137833.1 glutathione S-transferase [Bosea sp. BE168]MDR7174532.1 glutathione S-transferase [Bosea sp. BE271]